MQKAMPLRHGFFAFARLYYALIAGCGYSELDAMPADSRQFDLIVLGAGAAGLMCAATAAQRGRRVAVLEHNGQPGRKILISGGGRCNFTNLHCGPGNFISENPQRFAVSNKCRAVTSRHR